jgi:pilus assembly protein CpaB
MKAKSLVLLLVASGFGLVAMLGVMQVMQGDANVKEPTVRVLVATTDIPPGMPLDDANVGFKDLPQSLVPSGAVTKPDEYTGKCLIARAWAGDVILAAKLGGPEAVTASHQIPKGMRVATIGVNNTKSHSGLIRPTDRVDVVCTYEVTNPTSRVKSKRVKTVLEYIEVFAVDKARVGREGEVDAAVKNVSLLVTPEQFQLLRAVEKMGDLDLSLRNRNDKDKTEIAELSDEIFRQHEVSEGSRQSLDEQHRPAPASQSNLLQEFLTSAMTAVAAAAATPATADDETPMWTMTICQGTKIVDIDVLDESALPKTLSPAQRQRIRAESRGASSGDKTKPALAEPKRPAAFTPEPAETAPATTPAAAAPVTPATQASVSVAAPPALMPLPPVID